MSAATNRWAGLVAVAAMMSAAAPMRGQGAAGWRESTVTPIAEAGWTGPRTPDGQPDVTGFWSNTIGNHNNLTNPQGGGGDGPGGGATARRRAGPRAPSRISDPADGQIPLQPWARALQQEFDAQWPAGSDAALSYAARIRNGPRYGLNRAMGSGIRINPLLLRQLQSEK